MNSKIKLAIFIILIASFSAAIYTNNSHNITGNDVWTKVTIGEVTPTICAMNLSSGWNYVSFHCISNNALRSDILQSINPNVRKVFTYQSADSTDPWKSYNPDLPNWTVQQLNYLSRLSGYIIYLDAPAEYSYIGYSRSSSIPLRSGWNLVGYPMGSSSYINETMSDVLFSQILTYQNNTALVYIVGENNTWVLLEPNYAYWINSSASQSWMVEP